MDTKLHRKQQKILDFVREYYTKNEKSPTVREIEKAAGLTSTSMVSYHVDRLVERGLLKRNPHKERGLVPPELEEQMESHPIPLLGVISAGKPIPVPGEAPSLGFIKVSTSLLPKRKEDLFALQVQGDSMIHAMVHDGDYVVLRHQNVANPADMVAAWIVSKEETTLKYYDPQGKKVQLVSDNVQFEPIVVDAGDLEIKGVVIFTIRNYKNKPV